MQLIEQILGSADVIKSTYFASIVGFAIMALVFVFVNLLPKIKNSKECMNRE